MNELFVTLQNIIPQCRNDDLGGILYNILDGICEWLYSLYTITNSEYFHNFIHLKFLGGSLGHILAWLFFLVMMGCLGKFMWRLIKNWYNWIKIPKSFPAEQKDMSDDPAFTVRLNVLKGKASRLSVKLWGELEDMEKGGMARPEDEGYATYSKNLALATAYDEIIEAKPITTFALEELEWKFNNGALRTPDEIQEHKKEMEQELYKKSGLYDFEKNALEEEFENKHLLAGCATGAILMAIILFICCADKTDGVTIFMACFFFGLPLMVPAMAILFGTLVFIDLTFESKFYTVAKKAGKRYLPHIQTGVDAAGLAISLHSLGKMFKKKK